MTKLLTGFGPSFVREGEQSSRKTEKCFVSRASASATRKTTSKGRREKGQKENIFHKPLCDDKRFGASILSHVCVSSPSREQQALTFIMRRLVRRWGTTLDRPFGIPARRSSMYHPSVPYIQHRLMYCTPSGGRKKDIKIHYLYIPRHFLTFTEEKSGKKKTRRSQKGGQSDANT